MTREEVERIKIEQRDLFYGYGNAERIAKTVAERIANAPTRQVRRAEARARWKADRR